MSIIHEIVSDFVLKSKENLEELKQKEDKIMEMEEIIKNQQTAIKQSEETEIEKVLVELSEISDEANNQQTKKQKRIEHLKKQNKMLKDYIRNADATEATTECLTDIEITEGSHEMYKDFKCSKNHKRC